MLTSTKSGESAKEYPKKCFTGGQAARDGRAGRRSPCALVCVGVKCNQMVVYEAVSDETDRIFHALSDATRRDIVMRVVQREQSVSMLAESYAMSFAAVQKHVAVLERAHLVVKVRRGREQLVHGNPETMRKATLLLQHYEELWRYRAQSISDILAQDVSLKEKGEVS